MYHAVHFSKSLWEIYDYAAYRQQFICGTPKTTNNIYSVHSRYITKAGLLIYYAMHFWL